MIDILRFLQTNGQWISAIFVALFAGVQVWLQHTQNRQQIRLKRLELANEMCEIFHHYPYDKGTCDRMMEWLMSNRARFTSLLRHKDIDLYWNLSDFIFNLQQTKPYNIGNEKTNTTFFGYTVLLTRALGNARYGMGSDKKYNHKNIKKKIDSVYLEIKLNKQPAESKNAKE